jgi:hypothetical protein
MFSFAMFCLPTFRISHLTVISLSWGMFAVAEAEDKESLRLHWKQGHTYTLETTTETSAGSDRPGKMSMTQTTEMRVEKEKATSNNRVEVTFTSITGSLTAQGKTMSFDSKKPGDATPALREALGAALQKPFVLVYDQNDRFREARELGALSSETGTLTGIAALADSRAVANLFRKSLEMGLPSIPVSPGDTWNADETMTFPQAGEVHVDMTVKFDKWEERNGRKVARLVFDGKLANVDAAKSVPGSISIGQGSTIAGTVWFDVERGMVDGGDYTSELRLSAMGEVVPMKQHVTSKLIQMQSAK